MRRECWAILMVCGLVSTVCGQEAPESKNGELLVPESKQTTLELYVTAQQAYEMWNTQPGKVNVLDVRTPEEYIFVGHAAMARNIPLMFVTHRWNPERKSPAMKPNPDFVAMVKSRYNSDDTLLVVCRSGGRSKMAVNMLADEGFTNVYNVIDGMEGDTVDDSGSVFEGKRVKNGWKNSAAPWTYKLDPELMYLKSEE